MCVVVVVVDQETEWQGSGDEADPASNTGPGQVNWALPDLNTTVIGLSFGAGHENGKQISFAKA